MIDQTPTPIETRWSAAVAAGRAVSAIPAQAAATHAAEPGGDPAADYARTMAARRAAAKAAGEDPDGEARLVHALVAPGARIFDAGCGTGRVAVALAELGHPVVGVDADLSMLRVAAEVAPKIPFWLSDLADLDIPQAVIAGGFDAAVLAGNVVPYLAEGSLPAVAAQLASVLRRGGLVVAGFGLTPSHLPAQLPVTTLAEYDAACEAAGLEPVRRYAGWSEEDWRDDSPYVVAVHTLPEASRRSRGGWRSLFGRG